MPEQDDRDALARMLIPHHMTKEGFKKIATAIESARDNTTGGTEQ